MPRHEQIKERAESLVRVVSDARQQRGTGPGGPEAMEAENMKLAETILRMFIGGPDSVSPGTVPYLPSLRIQ